MSKEKESITTDQTEVVTQKVESANTAKKTKKTKKIGRTLTIKLPNISSSPKKLEIRFEITSLPKIFFPE
mgnify:CR=1 FL=1